jgi:hypothetical protein
MDHSTLLRDKRQGTWRFCLELSLRIAMPEPVTPSANPSPAASVSVPNAAPGTVQSNPDSTPWQDRWQADQDALTRADPWRAPRMLITKDSKTGVITARPQRNESQVRRRLSSTTLQRARPMILAQLLLRAARRKWRNTPARNLLRPRARLASDFFAASPPPV